MVAEHSTKGYWLLKRGSLRRNFVSAEVARASFDVASRLAPSQAAFSQCDKLTQAASKSDCYGPLHDFRTNSSNRGGRNGVPLGRGGHIRRLFQ